MSERSEDAEDHNAEVSPEEGGFQLIYERHNVPATYINVSNPDENITQINVNVPPVLVEAEQLTHNGLKLDIVDVNYNGWPLVKAQNHNNYPPLEGMTMALITVRVSGSSEIIDGAMGVMASHFELMGDKKQVYKTFEMGCGVIPDRLDGVVSQNISMDGNICFQIPVDESNLQLIYKPSHDAPPAYYNLPNPDSPPEK